MNLMYYLDAVYSINNIMCPMYVKKNGGDITSILLVLTTGPYQYFSLELKSTVDSDLNPLFVRITYTKQKKER